MAAAVARRTCVSDLAPGRPLHAETWDHLLAGARVPPDRRCTFGGEDRRIDRVASVQARTPTAINAAIDAVNAHLLGPGEYLLVAVRER